MTPGFRGQSRGGRFLRALDSAAGRMRSCGSRIISSQAPPSVTGGGILIWVKVLRLTGMEPGQIGINI